MRITREQAIDCFHSDDLIGIGMEADSVRRRLHPEGVVSYLLERNVPYNSTVADSLPAIDAIHQQIADAEELGATSICLHGIVLPELTLAWFESLFTGIRQRFPSIWLHSLSATEILTLAANASLSPWQTLQRLQRAGLDSIPGDDATILDDRIRQHIAPNTCNTSDWLGLHRSAHDLGIGTTASMLFGAGETLDQRLHHLEVLYTLQQDTGGFTAFTPRSLQPADPALRPQNRDESTSVEYLKTLAISRMVLDNIPNVQSTWITQGLKVLQMGLRFGGNDAGSVLVDDRLVKAASAPYQTTEEELRRIIRDAGFKPVQRDTLYRTCFLN